MVRVVWKQSYGDIYGDRPYDICMSDEYIILTGESWLGFGTEWGRENTFVIKLDNNGNLLQQKSYYRFHRDMGLKIKTTDNGYILNAFTKSADDAYGEILISKLDEDLEIEWEKILGEHQSVDYGFDILQNDMGYMVLGVIGGFFNSNQVDFTTPHSDIYLAQLSFSGNLLWDKKIGGSGHDMIEQGLIIENNLYLVGSTQTNSNGSFDMLLMKVSMEGDSIYSKTFGGEQYDMGRTICTDGQNLYLGGVTKRENSDYASANYIIACNLNAELLWERVIESSESDKLKDMVYNDHTETINIISSTLSEETGIDFWMYSLNQDGQFSYLMKIDKEELLVFPNPITDHSQIALPGSVNNDYIIRIFNISGQLVLEENRVLGNHYSLDNHNYVAGYYTFEIITKAGKRYTGKFIVY